MRLRHLLAALLALALLAAFAVALWRNFCEAGPPAAGSPSASPPPTTAPAGR